MFSKFLESEASGDIWSSAEYLKDRLYVERLKKDTVQIQWKNIDNRTAQVHEDQQRLGKTVLNELGKAS